jgi:hypothetical protein
MRQARRVKDEARKLEAVMRRQALRERVGRGLGSEYECSNAVGLIL